MGFLFLSFFVLVGGGFRAVQAPFWERTGVKCRFRAGGTRKTAAKNKISGSFLFSVKMYPFSFSGAASCTFPFSPTNISSGAAIRHTRRVTD